MKPPFSIFTVFGSSMEPTLKSGQKLVSFNWWYQPKKGDLVAVRVDGQVMVKRIQNIHDHEVFIIGDNSKMSTDSRKFGWIKKKQIIGKIIWYH